MVLFSKLQKCKESFADSTIRILVEKACQHCQVKNHSTLSAFEGRSYVYSFDNGSTTTKTGEEVTMKGNLVPLLPFGQILHQDVESIDEEAKLILQWGEEIGLVAPATKLWTRIQETAPVTASALFCGGLPLSVTRLLTISFFVEWVLDDILDNAVYEDRAIAFSYKNLMVDIQTFLEFLQGTQDQEELESKLSCISKRQNTLPKLVGFCKAMIKFRELAAETGVDPNYFFSSFSSYVKYCALEAIETNQLSTGPNELEYAFTKTHCQGITMILETIFLVNGLSPADQLRRQDPLFSTFCYLVGHHFGLVNDLLSLKKELALGETKNMVLVRARNSSQNSIQVSFDSFVDEVNGMTARIHELKSKLIEELAGTDQEIIGRKCMDVALNFINGHFLFYVNSKRYLNNDMYYGFEK